MCRKYGNKPEAVITRQTVDSPKDFVYGNLLFLCLILSIFEFRAKISLFGFRRLKSSKKVIKKLRTAVD